MKILLFHGYLLRGTGSNVYNAQLAQAFARLGHQVTVLAQERRPEALGWVDGERIAVRRPDIGELLPVYVADRYEGFEAKTFLDCTDDELERYVARNVEAVRAAAEEVRPDVALANHLVMGPAILARGLEGLGVPYAVKVHGSALEYTVKPHPRFLPHAREGLAPARAVLVGSRHTAESLWAAIGDPELEARTKLGPPGVDIAEFVPREPAAARAGLAALVERLRAAPAQGTDESSFARDTAAAADALATVDPERDRLVVFVGKLMASKGVDLLLAAWPLVLARVPDAKLVVVGFGAFREGLERLAGDLAAGRSLRGENGLELKYLRSFLEDAPPGYPATAERIVWAGRLDHGELADLLPAADAMVVPSTFPEAFGMVAAEAAACGALPVVARHSGLAEVAETLAGAVPAAARPLLTFDRGPTAVAELAEALTGWLDAPADLRAETREAMVAITRERYSWDGVARTVVAAAQGDLDALPEP